MVSKDDFEVRDFDKDVFHSTDNPVKLVKGSSSFVGNFFKSCTVCTP